MSDRNEYMWTQKTPELVSELLSRFRHNHTYLTGRGLWAKWTKAYNYYYGYHWVDGKNEPGIGRAGEQGEFSTISSNHVRNLVKHRLSLMLQNKISFDSQAINSDVKSRDATLIANAFMDQLFYEKRYEFEFRRLIEIGEYLGTSFGAVLWNPYRKLQDIDGDGIPVWSGEPKVQIFTPMDVLCEPFLTRWDDQQWVVTREIVNRWTLIPIFSKYKQELIDAPQIADLQNFDPFYNPDKDHMFLFRAYHRESPILPGGRYVVFTESADFALIDDINPYVDPDKPTPNGGLPIFCYRPEIVDGSAYGHSPIFDMIPVQEAMNLLDSTILSNQDTFGPQNVVVPRASSMGNTTLDGGLHIIEYDVVEGAPNGGMPMPLNLVQTPSEIFKQRQEYRTELELLSGVNSTLRGQPPPALSSGTAVALVATQANTFNSFTEANMISVFEDMCYFLIHVSRLFWTEEQIVQIVGKSSTYAVKTFKGVDFSPIQRVKVSLGNPLARTTALRIDMARELLSNKAITTAQEYMDIIMTGSITPVIEEETAELAYIRMENEMIMAGEKPLVTGVDNHVEHIRKHRVTLFHPDTRNNPTVLQAGLDHIKDHLDAFDKMSAGNPMLLQVIMGAPITLPQPLPETGQMGSSPQIPQANPELGEEGESPLEPPGGAEESVEAAAVKGEQMAQRAMAKMGGAGK